MSFSRNLQSVVRALIREMGVSSAPEIFFVSGADMREIKQRLLAQPQFLGPEAEKIRSERVVDVLAFPPSSSVPNIVGQKPSLGEIYVNRAVARTWGKKVALVVHGFLHLCGYRHHLKHDRIHMEQEEQRLLGVLGL